MGRSGDLIDNKVFEADFYLQKLEESGTNFFAARCYFSAFASASRSVTFAIQAVLRDSPGFPDWYSRVQGELRNNPLARFFLTVRNEGQKMGNTPLNFGSLESRGDGGWRTMYYFVDGYEGALEDVPEVDVVTACRVYLTTLVRIVYDCYETFDILSPLSFYSAPNLVAKGLTVEDMEEALGFPRGWTDVPGVTIAERYEALGRQFSDTAIDVLFKRYLGKVRTVVEQLPTTALLLTTRH